MPQKKAFTDDVLVAVNFVQADFEEISFSAMAASIALGLDMENFGETIFSFVTTVSDVITFAMIGFAITTFDATTSVIIDFDITTFTTS